jgi:hypothetical protein
VTLAIPTLAALTVTALLGTAATLIARNMWHGGLRFHLLPSSDAWWWLIAWAVAAGMARTLAKCWFDRDPRLPRIGPWVLAAVVATACALSWGLRNEGFVRLAMALSVALALGAFLAARLSRRVRTTFTAVPLAARGDGWRQALLHGPRDWSNGRWWQVGVIGATALLLARELFVIAGFASTPVPPPPPSGAGHAATLAQMLHPGDAIQAARDALLPLAAAAATWLVAALGRLRLARWTGAALLTAIVFAGIAAWHLDARDCCTLIDEATRPLPIMAWAALLIVALATGAWRHPGGSQNNAMTTGPTESPRCQRWTSVLAWPVAALPTALLVFALHTVWSLVHNARTGRWRDVPAPELWRELGELALIMVAIVAATVVALRWAARWFDRRAHAWSRLRWLMPAVLVVAIPGTLELAEVLGTWREPGPPPFPRPAPDAQATAGALVWGVWDQTVLARKLAPIAMAGMLLHIASFVGVVRGARWAGVTTVLTVATPIALGLTADALGCCMLAFGGDFAMYGAGTVILLALAVIGAITWTRRK